MGTTNNTWRLILSALIIIAFFLPWLNVLNFSFYSPSGGASAFDLVYYSLTSGGDDERMQYAFIFIIPLILIPLTALIVFIRSVSKRSSHGMLRAAPFIFFIIFSGLVVLGATSNKTEDFDWGETVKYIGVGFYITALASIILMFVGGRVRRAEPVTATTAATM